MNEDEEKELCPNCGLRMKDKEECDYCHFRRHRKEDDDETIA